MYLIWRNLNSPPDRFPTDFAPAGRKKFRQYFCFGKAMNHHLTRSRNIVLERTATGGWRTFGNKVEKAKLSARSPFDPLLCTWILCSLFSPLVFCTRPDRISSRPRTRWVPCQTLCSKSPPLHPEPRGWMWGRTQRAECVCWWSCPGGSWKFRQMLGGYLLTLWIWLFAF